MSRSPCLILKQNALFRSPVDQQSFFFYNAKIVIKKYDGKRKIDTV